MAALSNNLLVLNLPKLSELKDTKAKPYLTRQVKVPPAPRGKVVFMREPIRKHSETILVQTGPRPSLRQNFLKKKDSSLPSHNPLRLNTQDDHPRLLKGHNLPIQARTTRHPSSKQTYFQFQQKEKQVALQLRQEKRPEWHHTISCATSSRLNNRPQSHTQGQDTQIEEFLQNKSKEFMRDLEQPLPQPTGMADRTVHAKARYKRSSDAPKKNKRHPKGVDPAHLDQSYTFQENLSLPNQPQLWPEDRHSIQQVNRRVTPGQSKILVLQFEGVLGIKKGKSFELRHNCLRFLKRIQSLFHLVILFETRSLAKEVNSLLQDQICFDAYSLRKSKSHSEFIDFSPLAQNAERLLMLSSLNIDFQALTASHQRQARRYFQFSSLDQKSLAQNLRARFPLMDGQTKVVFTQNYRMQSQDELPALTKLIIQFSKNSLDKEIRRGLGVLDLSNMISNKKGESKKEEVLRQINLLKQSTHLADKQELLEEQEVEQEEVQVLLDSIKNRFYSQLKYQAQMQNLRIPNLYGIIGDNFVRNYRVYTQALKNEQWNSLLLEIIRHRGKPCLPEEHSSDALLPLFSKRALIYDSYIS